MRDRIQPDPHSAAAAADLLATGIVRGYPFARELADAFAASGIRLPLLNWPTPALRPVEMSPASWTPDQARAEASRAMAPMLRELRECMYLPDSDPRRVAAIAEKQRVLDLIGASGRRVPEWVAS